MYEYDEELMWEVRVTERTYLVMIGTRFFLICGEFGQSPGDEEYYEYDYEYEWN